MNAGPPDRTDDIAPTAGSGAVGYNVFWAGVAVLCLVLFLSRFFMSLFYEGWDALELGLLLIACCVLLYGSFLIEGIILVSAKIEEYDQDAMVRKMQSVYGSADNISTTLSFVKQKINDILVGQPLVAISITLGFGAIVGKVGLHKDRNDVLVAPAAASLPDVVIYLMSSPLISDALSAALIYWVAQLLPQSLGKRNAVQFMRLPFAASVAHGLVILARTGVGLPSGLLERLLSARFSTPLELPIGDEQIFHSLCSDFGYFVFSRRITIRPSEAFVEVTDETTYHYLEHRRDVRHSCRLAVEQFNGAINFTLIVPDDIDYEKPDLVPFELELSEISNADTTPSLKSIIREHIYVIESSITQNRPLTTRAVYRRNPLNTQRGKLDAFVLDMGVPTKQIEIRIEKLDGVLISLPTDALTFTSEVARFFPTVRPLLSRGVRTIVEDAKGWYLSHTYPPLCADMRLQIDARAANRTPQG